jgi:hypothetical protein
VEDNEVEAKLQEQEEATVDVKSNWGLSQHAGSSRDTHRFTGHAKGLRKCKAPTTHKVSSPLRIVMLYCTAIITLLEEKAVPVRSQIGDFPTCRKQQGFPQI